MRAGDGAKFFRLLDVSKPNEVLQGGLVRAPGGGVAQVREPLELGRYVGEALVAVAT